MSEIIMNFKLSFNMYLNYGGIILTKGQRDELNELFNKINEHYDKKTLWCAPEMLEAKAITSIYNFISFINDKIINERLRVFWNRYSTRYYFKNEFKFSKMNDPKLFYEQYANEKLKKTYNKKDYEYYHKYLLKKMNELKMEETHVKPVIVKLIEDDDYNFITQKDFKLYLIRSNNRISTHTNNVTFSKNAIDFYDEKREIICNKGIIWGLV